MLKKIKKFKLRLRPSYVNRAVKKALNLSEFDERLENQIQEKILEAEPFLLPQSIYQTFGKKESPEFLNTLWDDIPKRVLSISLFISSIDICFESKIAAVAAQGDPLNAAIWEAMGQEALAQCGHFTFRLLTEESAKESCVLLPAHLCDPSAARLVLSILEAEQSGISLSDSAEYKPRLTRVQYSFWQSKKKR